MRALDPAKDVDGFHPINVAKLALGDASGFVPCTPLGCQRLLVESGIEISGAHVVVLGRSMIVGKPVALLLMQKAEGANATVTVVHSRSRNLPEITRSADIIIAAIGQAHFVRAEHVRAGAVVIDVGINRVEDPATERGYRLVGDVAFDEVAAKAAAITPVPGGVGPMTIAMLMSNTVKACRQIAQRMTFAVSESQQRRKVSTAAQQQRSNPRRQDRGPRDAIHPEPAAIKFFVRRGERARGGGDIAVSDKRCNRSGRQLAGTQRVVNSFAGEWLDHASRVADQKQTLFAQERARRDGAE